jgi:hypothetical protein
MLFENKRNYQPGDKEVVDLLGSPTKQAQRRHTGTAPAYYRLARKIIYAGFELNEWAEANRIEPRMASRSDYDGR